MRTRYGSPLPGVVAFAFSIAMVAPVLAEGDAALGTGNVNPVVSSAGRTDDAVTFESLDLPPGTQMNPGDGVPTTVDGYTFTPGPNNSSGLNDSHYGNAVAFWGYNGTHVAVFHDDVVMTKEGGGTFDLVSFDFSGFPVGAEVSFTVTGQPGNVVANFDPDGIVDGQGGDVDFQNFVLPPTFVDLTSVTWEHAGAGTVQGLFGLDNIVIGKPVSVDPESWGGVKSGYR